MDELILRSIRGMASPEEEEAVRRWRQRSADNEAVFQELRRLLPHGLELEAAVDPGEAPSAADLIRRADERAQRASVMPISAARRPGGEAAEVKSMPSVRRLRARRWLRRGAAAAALVVLGVALAELSPGRPEAPAFGAGEIVTGPGEITTVELRDGSVVRIAPSSRLTLSASTERRDVHLDGRAFFAVASSQDRPFTVRTAAGEVQVLGTRFDLNARAESLRLVVTEGRVALAADENQFEVAAGEVGEVVPGREYSVTRVTDVHSFVDWTGNFLAFQDTPLAEAAAEIERKYDAQVVIADSALARQTITVWFADRALDDVIQVMCLVLDTRCSIQDGTVRIGQ